MKINFMQRKMIAALGLLTNVMNLLNSYLLRNNVFITIVTV